MLVNDRHQADHDVVWDVNSLSNAVRVIDSSSCFLLSIGSFLGNEALLGDSMRHTATAVVVSDSQFAFTHFLN